MTSSPTPRAPRSGPNEERSGGGSGSSASASASAPLRIGVLGAARIAPFALYAPAKLVDGVQVSGVAARDRARAEAAAKKHGIANVFDSYDAMLASADVDAVYNPLPNGLHAQWTIKALDAGKHVLCEKPLAANEREARAMAEAAQRNKRVLMEAFHWRFHPMAQRLVEIVQSGELGKLKRVETFMQIPLPFWNDIRYRLDLAGGAGMDVGAYATHMMRTLSGSEPVVVRAQAKLLSPGVDRWLSADVDLGNGATGTLTCSLWSSTLLKIEARVTGDRGFFVARNPVAPQLWHRLAVVVDGKKRVEKFDKVASYTCQLRAFKGAVAAGRADLCGPDDSILNMRLIDSVYRAAGLQPRGT